MGVLIETTANSEAAGVLTYGIEGEDPAFTLDTDGNITALGTLDVAVIDGGGP